MAIKKVEIIPTSTETTLRLDFTNGDLKALEDVRKKWKFIDVDHLLRFAIAVMSKAEKNKVYIDESGNKVGYSPADNLLEKDEESSSSTS